MIRPRVVGVGRRFMRDDAVGLLVAEHLRAEGAPVDVFTVDDPSEVVDLVQTPAPVVIVDAAVGRVPSGTVHTLTRADLGSAAAPRFSSHGLTLEAALKLAEVLAPAQLTPRLTIVAVYIRPPAGPGAELDPAVRAAIPKAARIAWAACGCEDG